MSQKITAIIVDDERLAIRGLELLLADYPHLDIIGSSNTIQGAVGLIQTHSPDVIFLDIQLQGETGFDLFEQTRVRAKVVFVTAYDAYAIRAFEINALDYLLKPVSRDRLGITLERIGSGAHAPTNDGRALTYDDTVVVDVGRRMSFVRVDQIFSITAEGDYTRVCLVDAPDELVSKSMKAWEAQLPHDQFARIHRSTILNIQRVHKIEKTSSNRYLAYARGRTAPFPMSQRYSARLRKRLGSSFDGRWPSA